MKVRYLKIKEYTIDLLLYHSSYVFKIDCTVDRFCLVIQCNKMAKEDLSGDRILDTVLLCYSICHYSESKLKDIKDILDCRKKEWLNYKGITKILSV